MAFPVIIWSLLILALIISSMGFYKYVWFISLGYGFSIAGLGVLLLCLFRSQLTAGTILCCAILIVYGCRLGGYLLIRERQSASYNKKMQSEIKDGKTMPFGVKCAIWITCAFLYMFQVLSVFYRLYNGEGTDAFNIVGFCIMALGLILETSADLQKQAAKKINPKRFCDKGLYRLVRCPNYLGEMIFWTGTLVSGLNILHGLQWVPALVGYAGIIFVMFSGARRLELRQNRLYGENPEYQAYVKSVPILLPFVPLYSVAKYKFLVA